MKASLLSLGLLAGTALAFPRGMDSMAEALQADALAQLQERDIEARQAVRGTEQGTRGRGLTAPLPLAPPPFDRKAQLVSNSGNNRVSSCDDPVQDTVVLTREQVHRPNCK